MMDVRAHGVARLQGADVDRTEQFHNHVNAVAVQIKAGPCVGLFRNRGRRAKSCFQVGREVLVAMKGGGYHPLSGTDPERGFGGM